VEEQGAALLQKPVPALHHAAGRDMAKSTRSSSCSAGPRLQMQLRLFATTAPVMPMSCMTPAALVWDGSSAYHKGKNACAG